MGLFTIFKAAGIYIKGAKLKVQNFIEFNTTTNPEIDSSGGGFVHKVKTLITNSWKLRDDTAGEDVLEIDTLNKKITLHPNYSGLVKSDETGFGAYVDTIYTSGSPQAIAATTDTILRINANNIIEGQKPVDIISFYFSERLVVSSVTGTFSEGETITGGTSGATGVIREIDGLNLNLINTSLIEFSVAETITGGTSGATANVDTLNNGVITGRNGDTIDFMVFFKAVPSSVDQWVDVWIDIGGGVGELYRQTFSFPKGSGTERGVLYSIPSGYTLGTWESNGAKIYIRSSASLDIYDININLDRTHKAV